MATFLDKLRHWLGIQPVPAEPVGPVEPAAAGGSVSPRTVPLDHAAVEKIMLALNMTDDNEMSCDEVFAIVDEYIDGNVLSEADVALLIPLIEKHLDMCTDCHECYEMIYAMVAPKGNWPIAET